MGTWNIEGLAFEPSTGFLLLGLRSPTQQHGGRPCAVVLVLRNPHAVFDRSDEPDIDPEPKFLDLGGLGIRGMTYDADRRGVWIVAGRSADPDEATDQVPSSVWFWDRRKPDQPRREASLNLDRLESLEGISLLDRKGEQGLLLISDDNDKGGPSHYLWVAKPRGSAR